jgi:hypothetical protein
MRPVSSLPADIQSIGAAFSGGLAAILDDKLYGVYLYGATVFEDGGPAQDVDCHVILRSGLTEEEQDRIRGLHRRLATTHPPLGGELDAYYILLADARRPDVPQHQLWPDIYDWSWALHCAHIRAGYYATLYGPAPVAIFPAPEWPAVAAALDHELDFITRNLQYPAYGVLNLCRILYSFQTGDVAVSKRFCGRWFSGVYPQWAGLIEAAIRHYDGRATTADEARLGQELGRFLEFTSGQIEATRHHRDYGS